MDGPSALITSGTGLVRFCSPHIAGRSGEFYPRAFDRIGPFDALVGRSSLFRVDGDFSVVEKQRATKCWSYVVDVYREQPRTSRVRPPR